MEVSSFQSNEVWKENKILHHQFGLVWSQTPVSDGKESKTRIILGNPTYKMLRIALIDQRYFITKVKDKLSWTRND